MKKCFLSLASVMSLSCLAYGGGNIVSNVEPIVNLPEVESKPFYIGVGISRASVNNDAIGEEISANLFMLQAGYKVNEYLAVEGRYAHSMGGSDYKIDNTTSTATYDGDLSYWGVYVKPMYSIEKLSLYALLGYGGVMLSDLAGGDAVENGFQWGLGVNYALSEKYSVFVDYVSLYDDTGFDYRAQQNDVDAETWTVGFSYRF